MRVAVFASGSGTNLQALIHACRDSSPARVVLVLSNRADVGALRRARDAGIPTHHIESPSDGRAIITVLREHDVDLAVLAGYLKLVPADVVAAYENRMINIHPALLPSFGGRGMHGLHVHRAVLDSGASVSGATVHLVHTAYDRGPIVAQWPVPVATDDTPETLQRRVLAVEHQLLRAVVLAAAHSGSVISLKPSELGFQTCAEGTPIGDALRAFAPSTVS